MLNNVSNLSILSCVYCTPHVCGSKVSFKIFILLLKRFWTNCRTKTNSPCCLRMLEWIKLFACPEMTNLPVPLGLVQGFCELSNVWLNDPDQSSEHSPVYNLEFPCADSLIRPFYNGAQKRSFCHFVSLFWGKDMKDLNRAVKAT